MERDVLFLRYFLGCIEKNDLVLSPSEFENFQDISISRRVKIVFFLPFRFASHYHDYFVVVF